MSSHELAADIAPESGLKRWTGWCCDLAGVMLAAMAVLIGVEILVRTVFGASTMIADEYSSYLFVWVTMLGFVHALQSGAFLRVDNVVARLSPRGQAASEGIAAIAGMAVTAVCSYATGLLWLNSWSFGTVSIQPSATPLYLPQAILPVGFGLLVVLYAASAVRALRAALSSRE